MAKFEKGNQIATGRPRGSLNQRSLDYAETLAKHNFSPAAALLDVFKRAMSDYESADPDKKAPFLNIAMSAADKMQPYVYPKLSSIEIKKSNPFEGMNPKDQLEAMKQIVSVLEEETKEIEVTPDKPE